MTPEERQLLRRVFAWARSNGWRRDKPERRYSEDRLSDRYGWAQNDLYASHEWVVFDVDIEPEGGAVMDGQALGGWVKGWVLSVREAVDVLAAKRILPVELSSAYAAGVESALDADEWRVVATKPRNGGEVINGNARSEREARALLKVALTFDSDARLEHRRFGATGWERVTAL